MEAQAGGSSEGCEEDSSRRIKKQRTDDMHVLHKNFGGLRNIDLVFIDKYEIIEKIGEGTFGVVSTAWNNVTNQICVLKMVKFLDRRTAFPIAYLREIRALSFMKHENIVNFTEMCCTHEESYFDKKYFLVLEYCDHDLLGLLGNDNVKFTLDDIKTVLIQILRAVKYIHDCKYMHRDIKPSNILVNGAGRIKLADFGACRSVDRSNFTCPVVTLYYRPPELLLGAQEYNSAVDLWGVGCVMVEMWTRSPIFQGNSEYDQLKKISSLCGSLDDGLNKLNLFGKLVLPKNQPRIVKEVLEDSVQDPYALDLIDMFLKTDPSKRITANNALDHAFCKNPPPIPQCLGRMLYAHRSSNMRAQQVHEKWRMAKQNNEAN